VSVPSSGCTASARSQGSPPLVLVRGAQTPSRTGHRQCAWGSVSCPCLRRRGFSSVGRDELQTFCLVCGGSQAAVGLLWGATLLFILPPSVGELMLGSLWSSASALIEPTTLAVAGGSLFDGAFVGLRALGVSRRSMPSQIARAIASVIGGIIGAFLGGAAGSVWGATAADASRSSNGVVAARHSVAAACCAP
jgi:hypothetical protein